MKDLFKIYYARITFIQNKIITFVTSIKLDLLERILKL